MPFDRRPSPPPNSNSIVGYVRIARLRSTRTRAHPPDRARDHLLIIIMRLELFFKTASELQALIALVRQHGIMAVNLVNKAKADPLLSQIRTIKVSVSLE